MKKARHSKSDFYLMLLEYRNTPTQVLGTTPAQRMLCRTIRSRLPAKAATREQKPVDMKHLTEQVEKAQRKQERTYNRGSKRLAPLNRGQAVRIRHRNLGARDNKASGGRKGSVVCCPANDRRLLQEKSSRHSCSEVRSTNKSISRGRQCSYEGRRCSTFGG